MASSASNTIGATLDAADNIVLALGREVNVAFQGRCAITKSECKNLHIDACRSRFPTGECTEEDLPEICTVDGDCGGVVRDMSNPSDRVPTSVATGENMSPSDLSAIETMCYSILLNNQMRAGFDAGAPYGASALYWGAWTGVFRYFPGNAQDVCGDCENWDERMCLDVLCMYTD